MTRYVFIGWQNGPTTNSWTFTVDGDIILTALYAKVVRNLILHSSPIAIQYTIGAQTFQSEQTVQVEDGATITVVAPAEVTV